MKYFKDKIKNAPSQYGCPSTACGRNTRTPLVLCSFLFHLQMRFNDKSFCEYVPNIIQIMQHMITMILNLSFMCTHVSTTDMTLRETQYPQSGKPVIDCSAVTS